ncbi:MAG: 3,4-dihydroxy-2-butanone-4-phosphate synthase [Acidobacteria bacterium]|nr:3,4-dihydroxy-2-butanone-4-phosphate synthase [Acidobacteriota bacterium]
MLATIPEAIEEIRQGRLIIIVDDEDRENEGDLVCAAEKITPELINFMAKEGRGLICLSLTEQRCDELDLPPMSSQNTSSMGTAFTVSIEAKRGVTTGISAADRATTILTAINPETKPNDLARPGHVFPLRAQPGGVLIRPGQTEASVDISRFAGLMPAGVICEIMDDDGTMARMPQLEVFAARHNLKIISVADLIRYRMETEVLVRRTATAQVPTIYGRFQAISFYNELNRETHLALVMGDIEKKDNILVRVHTHCLLGDVFGGLVDEMGFWLHRSLEIIAEEGCGVLLYLSMNNMGYEIERHLNALSEHQAKNTNEQFHFRHGNPRNYGIGAQILHLLGLRNIRLLTNHPTRFTALEGFGINIIETITIEPSETSNYSNLFFPEKLGVLQR